MHIKTGYFVTGIGTAVGKTTVTLALMHYLRQQGYVVAGMKPVAAGCEWREERWQNADAELIRLHSCLNLDYGLINPYAFAMPLSPHIACGDTEVNLQTILQAYAEINQTADLIVVEGAGGWLSPLSASLDNAALAIAMQLPVIVVVGMYLGCINHARLTLQALQQSGLACAGWVAVEIEADRVDVDANIAYLQQILTPPLLARLPYQAVADYSVLAACFNKVQLAEF